MSARKRQLTDADRRAAAKARELWEDYKIKNPGLSQEKAAAKAGMTQSALSQFLKGTVPMRVTPILKLAALFGVSPTTIRADIAELAYAVERAATPPKAQEPSPGQLSADALEIARIFERLEPQTKAMIREQIFIYSVIDHSCPWLRSGRPKSESYDAFERRHEQNMAAKLSLEATRRAKVKA